MERMDGERLRHLLNEAVDGREPPPSGARRVIERTSDREWSHRSWPGSRVLRVTGIAAVVVVLVAALGLAVASSPGP